MAVGTTTSSVRVDLLCEHVDARSNEARRTIGVLTRTTSFDHLEPASQLRLRVAFAIAGDEGVHCTRDRGEPVHAGAALTRVLTREPARDRGALGQATRHRRQGNEHATAEGGADGAQRRGIERQSARVSSVRSHVPK